MLRAARGMLHVVYCMLRAARGMLHVVYCMLRAALLRFAAGAAALGEPERLLESICVVGLPLATVRPAPPRPARPPALLTQRGQRQRWAAAWVRTRWATAGDDRGAACACAAARASARDLIAATASTVSSVVNSVFVQITAKNIGSRHAERRH